MGGSCSTTRKTINKRGTKRGGRKSRTRKGGRTRTRRGGCGCSGNTPILYGGYKYTRKASLAAKKRMSHRLSKRYTKRHKKRHKKRKRHSRRRR